MRELIKILISSSSLPKRPNAGKVCTRGGVLFMSAHDGYEAYQRSVGQTIKLRHEANGHEKY